MSLKANTACSEVTRGWYFHTYSLQSDCKRCWLILGSEQLQSHSAHTTNTLHTGKPHVTGKTIIQRSVTEYIMLVTWLIYSWCPVTSVQIKYWNLVALIRQTYFYSPLILLGYVEILFHYIAMLSLYIVTIFCYVMILLDYVVILLNYIVISSYYRVTLY